MNYKILISILNWNNAKYTINCITSLKQLEYQDFCILVVDNNSFDDSIIRIKEKFPDIVIVKNNKNLGYAGGHKIAAEIAIKKGFHFLWIINNDILVKADTLCNLIKAYKQIGDGLFGSFVLDNDWVRVIYSGGCEITKQSNTNNGLGYNPYCGKLISEIPLNIRKVSDIHGASILIPVKIIKKYGFMDTRFFLYGEETDYCYKLRYKYNIHSFCVPNSHIIHAKNSSFSNHKLKLIRQYYFTRNVEMVLRKYIPDYKSSRKSFLYLIQYFFLYYFFVPYFKKTFPEKLEYYENLGYLHSYFKYKGRYLNPEKFLNTFRLKDIVSQKIDLNIYINGKCDQQCKYCDIIYKQFPSCTKSDKELSIYDITKVIRKTPNGLISKISILGANIFMYTSLKDLIVLLKKINIKTCFYINYQNITLEPKNKLFLDWSNNFELKILVNLPVTDAFQKLFNIIKNSNLAFELIFIITSSVDFNLANNAIAKINSNIRYTYKPLFTGNNISFFAQHVFLTKEKIRELRYNNEQLFIRQKINTHCYGKLYIMTDGLVYGDLNHDSIGNIKISVFNLVQKEKHSIGAWLKTRFNVEPCISCDYNNQCPSPSKYEMYMGRYDTCKL